MQFSIKFETNSNISHTNSKGQVIRRWTVSLLKDDWTQFVKRVTFKLHESFTNCNRVVYRAPFEVTDEGWGEFTMHIEVEYRNGVAVDIEHNLILADEAVQEVYEIDLSQEETALMQRYLKDYVPTKEELYQQLIAQLDEHTMKAIAHCVKMRAQTNNKIRWNKKSRLRGDDESYFEFDVVSLDALTRLELQNVLNLQ